MLYSLPIMLLHTLAALLLLMLLPFAAAGARAQSPDITYDVSFEHRHAQLVDITMTVRNWTEPTLNIYLPVWRPGRYEVLDTAGSVRGLRASDESGDDLPVEKTQKSCWRISNAAGKTVRISYQLYANSIANRTRHVDETHAFLSGSCVFMYCHERRDAPLWVTLGLPPDWSIASGMAFAPGTRETLVAPDYDTLADSPIEAGIQTVKAFEVAGVEHRFVVWGRADVVPDSLMDDCAKIVKVQHDLFGSFPHTRYVFLTHIAPGLGGGTEHLNSTIIQAKPTAFDTPKDRRNFLALVAHEFFHTWNIKQFRPQGLKPYDYDRENYTTLLWVAEGTTSYYDELLCARAGVWKPDEYLEALASLIDGEVNRPGAGVQSLESSSFDAWIKFNRPTPDSINSTVSFYSKGALVNFLLDADIRARTENAKSLDDLMRALYQRFPLAGPVYTTIDLLSILRELTGADYEPFFSSYIRGVTPISPETIATTLAVFGLESRRVADKADKGDPLAHPASDGDAAAPDPTAPPLPEPAERAYLGIEVKDAEGAAVVTSVRADSPAYARGVQTDDQIVAMSGHRLKAADLDARLKKRKPGEVVTLTLFRRDQMMSIDVQLASKPAGKFKIDLMKNPTPLQRGVYESWMGQTWPSKGQGAKEKTSLKETR